MNMLPLHLSIAEKHAQRIKKILSSLPEITSIEDYRHLTDSHLDQIEILVNRFARLQDLLGSKIFPLVLEKLQENIVNLSMIDIINLLEKRGFTNTSQVWGDLRFVRNRIIHEYPEDSDKMFHLHRLVIEKAKILVNYFEQLKIKIPASAKI